MCYVVVVVFASTSFINLYIFNSLIPQAVIFQCLYKIFAFLTLLYGNPQGSPSHTAMKLRVHFTPLLHTFGLWSFTQLCTLWLLCGCYVAAAPRANCCTLSHARKGRSTRFSFSIFRFNKKRFISLG